MTTYQYKVVSATPTETNIIVSVGFKRNKDVNALRTENIIYPKGTKSQDIIADLEMRSKKEIDTYEADLVVVALLATTKNIWNNVLEKQIEL